MASKNHMKKEEYVLLKPPENKHSKGTPSVLWLEVLKAKAL